MVGFATSAVRDKTWILATYAVRPHLQARGIGKQLLDAALHHGRGCLRAMLSSSADPRAVRRYRLAGFSLHPQMYLRGTVDRSAIPVGPGTMGGWVSARSVRARRATPTCWSRSTDRRAAPPTAPTTPTCRRAGACWSPTPPPGPGYAYVDSAGGLSLLAASNRTAATRLLWTVLADGPEEAVVPHVTAANEWAIDVAMAARLEVHTGATSHCAAWRRRRRTCTTAPCSDRTG